MRGQPSAELHALKCELAGEVLRSSGRLRLRVTGWSMLPAIFPGDTLVIERANGESLGKGDIVLFHRDRRLFVHRVSGTSGSDQDLQIVTQAFMCGYWTMGHRKQNTGGAMVNASSFSHSLQLTKFHACYNRQMS